MQEELKLKRIKERVLETLVNNLEELDWDFNVSGNPFSRVERSAKANSLSNGIIKAIQLIDNVEL